MATLFSILFGEGEKRKTVWPDLVYENVQK